MKHFVWLSTPVQVTDLMREWKRARGHSRQTWIHQLETDVGLTADAAWNMVSEKSVRVQRPVVGHAVQ